MPTLKTLFTTAVTATKKHAPTILTATAVIGTAITASLSFRAGLKASHVLHEAQLKSKTPLTKKEKLKDTWKLIVPPAIVGGATAACIIGSHSLQLRKTAAIASMYTIAETTLKEYKEKVIETIGERKEQKIVDQITQEHIDANPVSKNIITHTGKGDTLCYESVTGRYFKSDIETIRKMQNDMVYASLMRWGYISLNQWCNAIGLTDVAIGDDIGWDNDNVLDVAYSTMMAENNQPCVVLNYRNLPNGDFRQR